MKKNTTDLRNCVPPKWATGPMKSSKVLIGFGTHSLSFPRSISGTLEAKLKPLFIALLYVKLSTAENRKMETEDLLLRNSGSRSTNFPDLFIERLDLNWRTDPTLLRWRSLTRPATRSGGAESGFADQVESQISGRTSKTRNS